MNVTHSPQAETATGTRSMLEKNASIAETAERIKKTGIPQPG
jgi:hypothetical protein